MFENDPNSKDGFGTQSDDQQDRDDRQSGDSDPWYVGQRDDHTGVTECFGIPYTYEHVDNPLESDECYRIEAQIRFTDRPIHRNVYYVPGERLDEFLCQTTGYGEEIVDIRPISGEAAADELRWFRGETDER